MHMQTLLEETVYPLEQLRKRDMASSPSLLMAAELLKF
jgi:hypothetical protein